MSQSPRLILLGQITGAHGIRGEVLVRTFTQMPQTIAAYGPLTDSAGNNPLTLKIVRLSDKGVVARIQEVKDRNAAEALRGRQLYVAREKLPEAAHGQYYHADLIGLTAVTRDGTAFGHVADVLNFGAGDLLEIKIAGKNETELVPFTNAAVPEVDLERGLLVVVPPVSTGDPEPGDDVNVTNSDA